MRRSLMLLAGVVLLVVLAGAVYALLQWRLQRQRAQLYDVALALGLPHQALLHEQRVCWDLQAHCALQVYYTTPESREQFAMRVAQYGLPSVFEQEVEGGRLFTALNISGGQQLMVDGFDDRGQLVPQGLLPVGYEWWLDDGRAWPLVVTFYTLQPAARYALNAQPLTGNVVVVVLQTR